MSGTKCDRQFKLLRDACARVIIMGIRKMAIRKIKLAKAFERNADLMFNLMRYILDQPAIVRRLPKRFELVILPEDDPELMAYNLEQIPN